MSVMVWGGITQETRTPLHVFDRGITGAIYTQDVLATHVVPFLTARPGITHLQQDNAPAHTCRQARAYLQASGVQVLNWPARSPDLNPIEQVWASIKHRLNRLQPRPQGRQQLVDAVRRLWDDTLQAVIRAVVRSVRPRCAAVIGVRGGNTRY